MENKNLNLSELSSVELEKLLKEKKRQEREERKRRQEEYELRRDEMVSKMCVEAEQLSMLMKNFKQKVLEAVEDFRAIALDYGEIRKDSKGGFSLRTKDGKYMVKYERNVRNEFDERAEMALGLINDFLQDTVKKRDQKSYLIISRLLVRNKAGDLNVSRVMQLLDLRREFDDERWQRAMDLLEESYRDRQVSYGISFYKKSELTGKDEQIVLNITSM